MKLRSPRLLMAILSLSVAIWPLQVRAVNCGTQGLPNNLCQSGDIQGLINFIANWITGIIGVVVVLIIIVSGIQMISSAGNPEAIKAARGRLTNAIIGLLLLIAMRVILNIILPPQVRL